MLIAKMLCVSEVLWASVSCCSGQTSNQEEKKNQTEHEAVARRGPAGLTVPQHPHNKTGFFGMNKNNPRSLLVPHHTETETETETEIESRMILYEPAGDEED